MKRLASSMVFFCVLVLSACTAQTTSANQAETYHYIVYQNVSYVETDDGSFAHDFEKIDLEYLADRTVFTSSFSAATVSVFTDGSLTVSYHDGWTASCPSGAAADACTVSAPHVAHGEELLLLIGFRDVVVLTGEYVPYEDNPIVTEMMARFYLIVLILGLLVAYRVLVIVLPRGVRGIFYPSSSMRSVRTVSPQRNGEGVKNYWMHADAVVGNIRDDMDERYGKPSVPPDATPATTLAERFRAQRVNLILSVLAFGIALAVMLIF